MQTSAKGLNLIRHYEGIVTKNGLAMPYQGAADKAGVLTIGWGHKMSDQEKVSMKNGIKLDAAETLFEKDVASHASKITTDVTVALNQDQFDSLSSFVFNLGKAILTTGNNGGKTTLLKELNAGNYEAAAMQMHLFCNSAGGFTAGLFYRRLTETLMFLTGDLKFTTATNCFEIIGEIGAACSDKTAEGKLLSFYKAKTGKTPPVKPALAGVNAKAAPPAKPAAAPAANAAIATAMPKIKFAKSQDAASVSQYSLDVLGGVLKAAGIFSVTITSTQRTAKDQARVMYQNLVTHGVASQLALYGPNGDKVVNLYAKLKNEGANETKIKAEMEKLITSIGPDKVSKHCADPKKLNVLDIDPAAIAPKSQAFIQAVSKETRISKLLLPPNDPAYHVEIPQP